MSSGIPLTIERTAQYTALDPKSQIEVEHSFLAYQSRIANMQDAQSPPEGIDGSPVKAYRYAAQMLIDQLPIQHADFSVKRDMSMQHSLQGRWTAGETYDASEAAGQPLTVTAAASMLVSRQMPHAMFNQVEAAVAIIDGKLASWHKTQSILGVSGKRVRLGHRTGRVGYDFKGARVHRDLRAALGQYLLRPEACSMQGDLYLTFKRGSTPIYNCSAASLSVAGEYGSEADGTQFDDIVRRLKLFGSLFECMPLDEYQQVSQ